MLTLINNTTSVSRIGYVVSLDTRNTQACVYATPGSTKAVGVFGEAVAYRKPAKVLTQGDKALVYVNANVNKGDVIRLSKAGDNITLGGCTVAKVGDAPYLKIGDAISSGRGLIPIVLELVYINTLTDSLGSDAVADGVYTVGLGVSTDGIITIKNGVITNIQEATAGGSGADPWTVIKLAQDFVSSSSSNVNVTNFYFTPAINKTYLIFGYFLLRTATATVGARPGVAWPANLTDATIRMEASTSLTASVIRTWGARTTQNAKSTGLATTTDSHWGSLDGIMITSGTTSGNFQITIASETAGTNVTMKAGSILMYREL